MDYLKKYKDLLLPYKKKVINLIALIAVVIFSSASVPYLIGRVISTIESNNITYKYLLTSAAYIIFLYAIWNIANVFVGIKFGEINKNIQRDIRINFYKEIFDSSISKFTSIKEGDLLNRISGDTTKFEQIFNSFFTMCTSIISVIVLIIIMFSLNFYLSIILLLIFVLIIISQRVLAKPLESLYKKYGRSEDDLLNDVKSNMNSFLNIKIFNLKSIIIDNYKLKTDGNLNTYLDVTKRISGIKNLNYFLAALFKISPIYIGAIFYSKGLITIGTIFSLYSYSIQLTGEIRSLIECDIVIKQINASFSRINDSINILKEPKKESKSLNEVADISMKDFSFSYEDKTILKDININFRKGDIVLITGENGSGKSTLLSIISGIEKAPNIYYNGISSSELSEDEILKNISYMLQQGYLFPASILDNITCHNSSLNEEAINICKHLGIDDRISKLPNGYDTIVNDRNSNLSGGEKQIISLARVLLKKSSIIILDEANSALDRDIENKICSILPKYFNDKIVFIVTHKGDFQGVCNRFVNLSNGHISETCN